MLAIGAWLVLAAVSRPARAVPLTDLFGGSSITVGDCLFTDWQLVSLSAEGTNPSLSLVSVNPLANDLGNPGIQFVGGNQLTVSGFATLDLVLKYRVQALAAGNTFEGHSLTITGLTFGSGGGVGFVSDGLTTGPGVNLDSAVAIGNPVEEVFQFADAVAFSPQSGVFVTTNVFLKGVDPADTINLTTINQRFFQTGPPVVEGDYNENGVVDAADYTVWRDHLGASAGALPNDTIGGTIGVDQYNLWKTNFGNAASGAAGLGVANMLPEPATGCSLAGAVLSTVLWGRRGRVGSRRGGDRWGGNRPKSAPRLRLHSVHGSVH